MHPIFTVLRLGGGERPIGSYGVMVGLAIFVAGFASIRATIRAKDDVGAAFAVLACMVAGGFATAWLTYGIVETIRTGTLDALAHGGGLVAYGSVPGALIAMMLSARWLRLPAWKLLELSLPGVASAHAIGRMGCLLGGCCYGAQSSLPWAITYTDELAPAAHPSIARHPSPLYEAIGLLVIAIAFALWPVERAGRGIRLLSYLGAYAVLRIGVEATRGDAIRGVVMGVSTSQMVSVIALVVAVLGLRRMMRA
jgi:phosphatidylglycerol---prolipoprotein diacylglyceryl transferase